MVSSKIDRKTRKRAPWEEKTATGRDSSGMLQSFGELKIGHHSLLFQDNREHP